MGIFRDIVAAAITVPTAVIGSVVAGVFGGLGKGLGHLGYWSSWGVRSIWGRQDPSQPRTVLGTIARILGTPIGLAVSALGGAIGILSFPWAVLIHGGRSGWGALKAIGKACFQSPGKEFKTLGTCALAWAYTLTIAPFVTGWKALKTTLNTPMRTLFKSKSSTVGTFFARGLGAIIFLPTAAISLVAGVGGLLYGFLRGPYDGAVMAESVHQQASASAPAQAVPTQRAPLSPEAPRPPRESPSDIRRPPQPPMRPPPLPEPPPEEPRHRAGGARPLLLASPHERQRARAARRKFEQDKRTRRWQQQHRPRDPS